MESGFANTYGVELLFEQPPSIDKKGLLAALRRRCGPVDPLDKDEEAGLLSFVHLQHLIPYTDGQAPAQTFMALSETGPDMEKLDPALQ
jgi:hypothetical protein